MAKKSLVAKVAAALPIPADAPQVVEKQDGEAREHCTVSESIRTVEDLLRHIGADMTRFEVERSEATKWAVGAKDPATGQVTVTDLHRVFVRLRPKGGMGQREAVEAILEGARRSVVYRPAKRHRRRPAGIWQVLVVADPHFGKYCWGRSTGGADYDLTIAERLMRQASSRLIDEGDTVFRPERRTICLCGDIFHYDSPGGMTTGGTMLDRDGRIQKMLEVGTESILNLIHRSAETCQTDVLLVAGNHDEALSWALHRILLMHFAKDKRVTIADSYTHRAYTSHGKNLIGITHGNTAKKKLAELMAYEAADKWSACHYREMHTGHFHSQAAIDTISSVVVRTHPAICPPDDWHAAHGFVGSRRGMETFFYRPEGGLAGMLFAGSEENEKC